MMRDIIRTVVDALHEVNLVTLHVEYHGGFFEFALAAVGWGSLLLFVLDGRPFVGLQISYGKLTIWFGPWCKHLGFGKAS